MTPRLVSKTRTLLFLVCATAGAAYAAPPAPVVTITPSSITATGVTPGTQVAFFGVGLEPKKYHVEVHRWSGVVTDTGHTGMATFTLDTPVPWNVVWIVADLRNGHYAIASTVGFPTMTPDRPRFRLKRDAGGSASLMGYSRSSVEGLYIEAGGAWIVRAEDGGDSDADGKGDGETTIDVLQATPILTGSTPPGHFNPGGTLLVIDISRLDVLTVPIDEPLIEGAR
jgi:hypothetical protein